MMISGNISAQSSVSEIERDSIVIKITRGKECFEQLVSANEVILEADKTIIAAKNVISAQSRVILNYDKQVKVFRDNEILFNKRINKEIDIAKQYKKKNTSTLFLGVGIGTIIGFITTFF